MVILIGKFEKKKYLYFWYQHIYFLKNGEKVISKIVKQSLHFLNRNGTCYLSAACNNYSCTNKSIFIYFRYMLWNLPY